MIRKRDHPRLRGEHIILGFVQSAHEGSPPPTRGTQAFLSLTASVTGITPAYAGNTVAKALSFALSAGSPPPTRGTLIKTDGDELEKGITPAYAGNT